MADFRKSKERETEGRCAGAMAADLQADVAKTIRSLLPGGFSTPWPSTTSEQLRKVAEPVFYGVAKTLESSGWERETMSCLRLGLAGSRFIVLVERKRFEQFVETEKSVKEKPKEMSSKFIKEALRELDAAAVGRLIEFTSVLFATLGPGGLLYMPTGWCFAEAVLNDDHGGFRFPIVTPLDREGAAWLEWVGSPLAQEVAAIMRREEAGCRAKKQAGVEALGKKAGLFGGPGADSEASKKKELEASETRRRKELEALSKTMKKKEDEEKMKKSN